MQTHTYLPDIILRTFIETELNLSKPLRTMLSALIVCLLENNKAHMSRLGVLINRWRRCRGVYTAYPPVLV